MNYDNWKLETPKLREIKEEVCLHCGGSCKDDEGNICGACKGTGTILTD